MSREVNLYIADHCCLPQHTQLPLKTGELRMITPKRRLLLLPALVALSLLHSRVEAQDSRD